MNIVLLGGNGYIGRTVTQLWMKKEPNAQFYILSRSGKNKLSAPQITNIKVDVSDYTAVSKVLPANVAYIADFVGQPEKDEAVSLKVNTQPALVMKQIAEEKQVKAMGFIGGILGPKKFVTTKNELINTLSNSSIKLSYVEPTVVYGNDRQDALAKVVPIFKFLGFFSKKMQPIHVEQVAKELIDQMTN